ncbi:MAG: efflux RND transporter periplasmic adaptor subunit [Pseudomonadota bacterium]|nr:efflux RND transporter periplasmic adaptor subunit [Pseudomonadota bacterium]
MLGVQSNRQMADVAHWPVAVAASPVLIAAARRAVMQSRVVVEQECATKTQAIQKSYVIAHPLVSNDKVLGVIAIEVEEQSDTQQNEIMGMLRAGSVFFEMLLEQQQDENRERLTRILELVSLTLDQPHFQSASTALATRLANELSCSRVSIGFLRGRFVTVRALSHSAKRGVKTSLLRAISAAMEEAIDQDTTLVYPGKEHINIAHRKLTEQNRVTSVCTIPLVNNNVITGAITFERNNSVPFDMDSVELYTHVANLIGPILELKRTNDCWPIVRLLLSVGSFMKKLFGPHHAVVKAGSLLLFLLTIYMSLATAPYRVTAKAALQGSIQRAVVAPIDAFILESYVRAGDVVEAGQLMGTLDDRELKLEQQQLTSEKARHAREYRSAMAVNDRAQVAILNARISQSDAQLQLINKQLERMQIISPLSGVVVSGDLSQSLGSPVSRGDVLFEVAPLEDYRLVLNIDERDMPYISLGQDGQLKLSGLPGDALGFSVRRITPVSEADNGANYYRIEAQLDNPPALLRPGMEGVGKVEVGEHRLLWIWTHRMFDWLKLQIWAWWP